MKNNMKTKINNNNLSITKSKHLFWKDYKLNLSGTILSKNILEYFISSFYDSIISKVQEQIINYAIILKIEFTDNTTRCISKVLVINKNTPIEKVIGLLVVY